MFFFFNDTATTEIYTLSLHDALPISARPGAAHPRGADGARTALARRRRVGDGARRPPFRRRLPHAPSGIRDRAHRSEEHTSELQSPCNLVCRLLLEKKKKIAISV